MTKKTLKIEGMHCTSCAMTIEWKLEDIGVKAKCNFAKSEVEVFYEEKEVREEQIRQAIESCGYLAR